MPCVSRQYVTEKYFPQYFFYFLLSSQLFPKSICLHPSTNDVGIVKVCNNNIVDNCRVRLFVWVVGYNATSFTPAELYHVCQPLVCRWSTIFVESCGPGRQLRESVVWNQSRDRFFVRVRLSIAVRWTDLRCERLGVRFVAAQSLPTGILRRVRPAN